MATDGSSPKDGGSQPPQSSSSDKDSGSSEGGASSAKSLVKPKPSAGGLIKPKTAPTGPPPSTTLKKAPPMTPTARPQAKVSPAVAARRKLREEQMITVGKGGSTLSKGGKRSGIAHRPGGGSSRQETEDEGVQNIEDRVLAQPWAKGLNPHALFLKYLDEVAPRIDLKPTSHKILKTFSNTDEKSGDVAECLRRNPYYESYFFEHVASLSKREEKPGLETAIVLLGMQNSRNLIVALQMKRTTGFSHPEWTEEGKLSIAPKDDLKYALKTEEIALEREFGHANLAFAAGMVFDNLIQSVEHLSGDPKKTIQFIDQIYSHSLRAAKISAGIASRMSDFPYSKYAFSAGILHDIGKVVMGIMNPAYQDFVEECRKKDVPREIRIFLEESRFGVSHPIYSAMICQDFHFFQEIEKALYFHHEPFQLLGQNKNLHQICSLIHLSTNIASNMKTPTGPEDEVLLQWKGPGFEGFKLSDRELIAALAEVSKKGI